ncbi:MAG: Gfo/Idh/MocA family oxidoreductase [Verrucomicrobia bacterium]|nr:Gfo/Idh/MocA family oxidoreductase [Verrucomicrobiota bacterium]
MSQRSNVTRREFGRRATASVLMTGVGLARGAQKTAVLPRPLKVGWVGTGGRGTGLLNNALKIEPGLQVTKVCDCNKAAATRAAEIITKHGLPAPKLFTDGDWAWQKMLQAGSLDAVIIATPWKWHTPMAVAAMNAGITPAVEVPCALTSEECWQLVDISEKTGVECMMLENWSFRPDNLALLNMVRAGLFGTIVHVHCAHSHNCVDHWFFDAQTGADRWPAEYLVRFNRDQYPTHSVGPVLSWCDINCGDRFTSISSAATDSLGINDMFKRRFGADHPSATRRYAQGDIVTSTLRTEKGRTVIINYDMQLPRPYDNRWMLQGTRGVYSEERNAIHLAGRSSTPHGWDPFPPYEQQYKHSWSTQSPVGGHGGADGVELRVFFEAVRDRRPLPLDVYDSVTMSAIVDLSGQSIAKNGQPVPFPDFTRGKWRTTQPKFAVDPLFAKQ